MVLALCCNFLVGKEAAAHVAQGYMPDAIADMEYRILLEFKPDDIMTRNKLAMVLYRQNLLDEAEEELHRVLAVDPDNYDALDGLGLVRFKQNDFSKAMEYFHASIAANDKDILVYYHLGQVQEELGMPAEAENSYSQALLRGAGANRDNALDNELNTIQQALSSLRAKRKNND